MRTQLMLAAFAALISTASAFVPDQFDFGNLPQDHVLFGSPEDATRVQRRQASSTSTRVPDSACTNSPTSRQCWSNGYSVATDFDQKWPTTGITRQYTLTVTNTTCNPDGRGGKICYLFNNQFPGPTIEANWGDTISITVVNNMQDNATSVHWHGIRQHGTAVMDGVNGITECPLAPGSSETYTFQATQFGTTWYHSHHSIQYGDGLTGPIVIHGPASANYDIDMGPVVLTDWYYKTAQQINLLTGANLQMAGPPPPSDNILINGLGKDGQGNGQYATFTATPNKTHLLRLVNTGVDNALRFGIEGHQLQVITADFVPVKPIWADSVMVGVGQRYNVLVRANQTVGNYWMYTSIQNTCNSSTLLGPEYSQLGVFRYDGAPAVDPPASTRKFVDSCSDPGALTPWVPNNALSVDAFKQQAKSLTVDLTQAQVTTNGQNIVVWGINMTSIDVSWTDPVMSYVKSGNTSYPRTENLIELPNQGVWTYWILQETTREPPIYHPIHLHGHDFYVLGSGPGTFDVTGNGPNTLTYTNPTRRDTVMLPAGGWTIIAFPTDNPGAWLMHCHIAWHISEGLGVQFLESKSMINLPGQAWSDQCSGYAKYQPTAAYQKDDSGI